jgi:WD40 repeat protein
MVDGFRDDESLVVAVNNRVIYVVDASTGRTKPGCSGPDVFSSFELSPSGKWAAILYKNGTASVWALDKKKNPVDIPHGAKIISAVFKPIAQEEIVLTAGDDGTAKLWELGGLEIRLINVFEHRGSPMAYGAFEDMGNRILTMSEEGILRIWDSSSGKLQVTIGQPKRNSAQ